MELVNGHTLQAVTDVPDPAILYDKLIKLLIKVWLLMQFSVGFVWFKNHLIVDNTQLQSFTILQSFHRPPSKGLALGMASLYRFALLF